MTYRQLYKLIICLGLLAAAAAIYMTTELWPIGLLLLVVDMVLCWHWFVATHTEEQELPCSAVCCCYFLGDEDEGKGG